MDIKSVLFLLNIVLVTCESGDEGYKFKVDDKKSGVVPVLLSVAKRQNIGYTTFTEAEAEAIVERHNFHRKNVEPKASNMRHMTWDNDLATMSQTWADGCVYKHGGTDGSDNISPFTSFVGQNLAVGTKSNSNSGVAITDLWHDEVEFYTYYTHACRSGEVCGHYTQVVWADSYKVGCGRKLCPSISVGASVWRNAYYIVCEYGPGGNTIGQVPYKTGDGCSECPNDAGFCTENSLCRDCAQASSSCGECNRVCDNCGTLDTSTCTCQCAPGWSGGSCREKCADHHERCGANPGWYGPELCEGWTYSDSVREYCLKMCGICETDDPSFVCGGSGGGGGGGTGDGGTGGGGDDTGCTNNNEGCAAWAASGECEINPSWMLVNCQRSCKVCEPAVKNTKYCKTSYTATSVIDGNLLVFKKDKYWMFDDIRNGALQSSAAGDLVRDAFPNVNPDVRAVYQRPDSKVVFMRGAKYWLYTKQSNGWTRDTGFPKDISQTFPGLGSPTAAVYDPVIDRTYLFSGTKLWIYNEGSQQFDIEGQPISSIFEGVPDKISGAFMDYSDFIFVKGKDFWRVRRGTREVTSTEPENLALAFLDCYE